MIIIVPVIIAAIALWLFFRSSQRAEAAGRSAAAATAVTVQKTKEVKEISKVVGKQVGAVSKKEIKATREGISSFRAVYKAAKAAKEAEEN